MKARLNLPNGHVQALRHVSPRGQLHRCRGLHVKRSNLAPLAFAVQRRELKFDGRHSGLHRDEVHALFVPHTNLVANSGAERRRTGPNANTTWSPDFGRTRLEVDAGVKGEAAQARTGLNEA